MFDNNMQHHQCKTRSRIRRLNASSSRHTLPPRISAATVWVFVAFLLPLNIWSFLPQHHPIPKTTSIGQPLLSTPSSSSKRSSNHFYALDYRDLSTRSKYSRLSLSSIAVPVSSASSLLNDGSDYYSWLSYGLGSAVNNSNFNANIFAPAQPQITQHQQQVRSLSQSQEYQRRKEEWAKRYTSLNGLRKAFGCNRNKFWGDLDPVTTRKLYKSLLPNALCELILELGIEPEELAPLAYQARKAAKLYARERCQVPARIASILYDGFRQWRRYGRFQPSGMSYQQLWDKYYHQQLEEVGSSLHEFRTRDDQNGEDNLHLDDTVTEEEIVSQTCQKILERACTTNKMVDQMVLKKSSSNNKNHQRRKHHQDARQHRNDLLLKRISRTLERDVRKLLDPTRLDDSEEEEEDDNITTTSSQQRRTMTPQQYHALKLFALSRRQSDDTQQPVAVGRE